MSASSARPTTPFMRFIFYLASGLVLVAGFQLFVLSEQTETFFSWTIVPFLTAAFLGGGYWTSVLLEFLAARENSWARARVAVAPVLIFTTLTLFATLLHLDRFHFNSPNFLTVGATWTWLAIYASVPVLMTVALLLQLRTPGDDTVPSAPLPGWMRAILAVQAVFMVGGGIVFFLAPFFIPDPNAVRTFFLTVWPWPLTALTGRAVAAWLVGLGIAAATVAKDNNLHLAKVALSSSALFGILEFIALARYWLAPDIAGRNELVFWVYILFLLSMVAVGVYGTYLARNAKA